MQGRVRVRLGDGQEHVVQVGAQALAATDAEGARLWLLEQFAEAGCEPSNPMGKVLAADLLLGVAASGVQRLQADPAWAARYAASALRLRGADEVLVDLAAYAVR